MPLSGPVSRGASLVAASFSASFFLSFLLLVKIYATEGPLSRHIQDLNSLFGSKNFGDENLGFYALGLFLCRFDSACR